MPVDSATPFTYDQLDYPRLAATRAREQVLHIAQADDAERERLRREAFAKIHGAKAALAHLEAPGGRPSKPAHARCRFEITKAHAEHPAWPWETVTHMVANKVKVKDRYARRAGEAEPSLRW